MDHVLLKGEIVKNESCANNDCANCEREDRLAEITGEEACACFAPDASECVCHMPAFKQTQDELRFSLEGDGF